MPATTAPTPLLEHRPVVPDVHALYEDHSEYVRAFLSRLLGPDLDPDDLTQEVFIRAWRKPGRFDGALPRAWLRQIAVYVAETHRRRSRLRRFFGIEEAGELVDTRTPERDAEANETTRIVYAVLDRMSEKRRTVFILFEIQGLSGEEIATALNCPLKTVYTRLFHARREFQTRIEGSGAAHLLDSGGNRRE